jgi:hypothetical protein
VRSHFLSQSVPSAVLPRLILPATWQAGSFTGVVRRARGDRINFLKKQTDFGSCAEEERDLTRPEGLLGGGPFPVLLTHHTRSPSERYVKQFRRLGSWERIDYVRDVKAQPPARTRLPRAFALLLLGGQQTSPYHGWRER